MRITADQVLPSVDVCRRCRWSCSRCGTGSPARRRRPCPSPSTSADGRRSSHVAGHAVLGRCREHASAQTRPAVRRHGTTSAPAVVRVRHDDVPVRLHDRLAAETRRAARREHRAPGDAAVGRRDHAHVVARAVVVELDVAVAVVRALRPRVACDPGLVPEAFPAECRQSTGFDQVRPPSVERLTSRM